MFLLKYIYYVIIRTFSKSHSLWYYLIEGGQQNAPLYIMSEEHKMTKQDKLVLTITLAVIFFGVFGLGLIGLIINLSS